MTSTCGTDRTGEEFRVDVGEGVGDGLVQSHRGTDSAKLPRTLIADRGRDEFVGLTHGLKDEVAAGSAVRYGRLRRSVDAWRGEPEGGIGGALQDTGCLRPIRYQRSRAFGKARSGMQR